MSFQCDDCKKTYDTLHALRCHISRESQKPEGQKCKTKYFQKVDKQRKLQAELRLKDVSPELAINAVDQYSNQQQLMLRMDEMLTENKQKMNQLIYENKKMSEKCEELSNMMKTIQTSPQICQNFYVLNTVVRPIQELSSLDLSEPRFQEVLSVLKKVPEFGSLTNKTTIDLHNEAARKLGSIQPSAVQSEGCILYKDVDVMKIDNDSRVARSLIDCFSRNSIPYAIHAYHMINECKRETDFMYKNEILKNASLNCIPNITELSRQDGQLLSLNTSTSNSAWEKKSSKHSKCKKKVHGTLCGFLTYTSTNK